MEQLNLTQEWDKVFSKSDKVEHGKVTFHNRYGITLAADVYMPKNVEGKLPAIAVSGPFGAVKEQSSGLYAQKMAELGFLTIAFDPSYTGESGGTPRYVASPDINTEDFCAAVDFLSVQENVDPERIGIIGICGWGGMAVNAAAIDTRIKATAAMTMYDLTRATANGYFDAENSEQARFEKRKALNAQKRQLRACRRRGRSAAGGRTAVCKGLLRLLQESARLPPPQPELQRWLECDVLALIPEYADFAVRQRDPLCCVAGARREGALPLLQRNRLQQTDRKQQGAAHYPWRQPHRPLRSDGCHSVCEAESVLWRASEIRHALI